MPATYFVTHAFAMQSLLLLLLQILKDWVSSVVTGTFDPMSVRTHGG
jgi:hypothetical protein